jgi:AcrR family transcriptional regulator
MIKEKIIKSTVELIKSVGVDGLSVRKIAELADVNVASINYHFGSKDKLVNEILKASLFEFRGTFNILDKAEISPLKRLRQFLLDYLSLLKAHPELFKIVLSPEKLFDSHLEYVEFLKHQGFDKLIKTVLEIVGYSNKDKVNIIVRQMFASIFFPVIILGNVNSKIKEAMEQNMFGDYSAEENIDLFLDFYFSKFNKET